MSTVMAKSQQLYKKVLFITLLLILGLTALLWGFEFQSGSFLLGCAIAWLAQVAFVVFLFARQQTLLLNAKVKALYQAQGLKFGVTVVLFIVVLRTVNIHAGAFFSGYLLVVLFNGLLPFLLSKGKN
ncbi:hypothetical protein HPC38_08055 [Pasteurellaceae bacterium HPA106]|uniref:ATP synthase subunit I n=1 Tax=Spirabiliibacterium pneumoniae TaxID=221400 RepID=UPI001AACE35B|nr:ATP synthase subunit I [Spirabiliibacterium pneumoniae]MBE2896822.1 hypothetical protein [Spirabiliibacterium pneumoniae]